MRTEAEETLQNARLAAAASLEVSERARVLEERLRRLEEAMGQRPDIDDVLLQVGELRANDAAILHTMHNQLLHQSHAGPMPDPDANSPLRSRHGSSSPRRHITEPFVAYPGRLITPDIDGGPKAMPLYDAREFCLDRPDCVGFTVRSGITTTVPTMVQFKSDWKLVPDPDFVSYAKGNVACGCGETHCAPGRRVWSCCGSQVELGQCLATLHGAHWGLFKLHSYNGTGCGGQALVAPLRVDASPAARQGSGFNNRRALSHPRGGLSVSMSPDFNENGGVVRRLSEATMESANTSLPPRPMTPSGPADELRQIDDEFKRNLGYVRGGTQRTHHEQTAQARVLFPALTLDTPPADVIVPTGGGSQRRERDGRLSAPTGEELWRSGSKGAEMFWRARAERGKAGQGTSAAYTPYSPHDRLAAKLWKTLDAVGVDTRKLAGQFADELVEEGVTAQEDQPRIPTRTPDLQPPIVDESLPASTDRFASVERFSEVLPGSPPSRRQSLAGLHQHPVLSIDHDDPHQSYGGSPTRMAFTEHSQPVRVTIQRRPDAATTMPGELAAFADDLCGALLLPQGSVEALSVVSRAAPSGLSARPAEEVVRLRFKSPTARHANFLAKAFVAKCGALRPGTVLDTLGIVAAVEENGLTPASFFGTPSMHSVRSPHAALTPVLGSFMDQPRSIQRPMSKPFASVPPLPSKSLASKPEPDRQPSRRASIPPAPPRSYSSVVSSDSYNRGVPNNLTDPSGNLIRTPNSSAFPKADFVNRPPSHLSQARSLLGMPQSGARAYDSNST
ncbi:hypothetical protein DIPPA_25794 [Diplonema papillatum]|nr:hypothetical protein DIPPA_25794 [Diplonema papillatum]